MSAFWREIGGKDLLVPLTLDALALLRRWLAVQPGDRFADHGGAAWVFCGRSDPDQPLMDQAPQRWYRAAAAAAGTSNVERRNWHGLRSCGRTCGRLRSTQLEIHHVCTR